MSTPRILVVEDEIAIQRGLCDVLAYRGYAPTGVADGEDGLRAGLAGGFALVLLDVMLPGLSGFDVCASCARSDPRLPILMLTARGAEEDVLARLPLRQRRLRDQAVLGRGADGARRGAAAARPSAASRLRSPSRSRSARGTSSRTRARRVARRRCDRADARARSRSWRCSRASAAGSSAAAACSPTSGAWARPSGSRRAPSTCTSPSCARSWAQQGARLIETVRGEGYRFAG